MAESDCKKKDDEAAWTSPTLQVLGRVAANKKPNLELNYQLVTHMEHADALVKVALEAKDFLRLPNDTQYNFLCVLGDQIGRANKLLDRVLFYQCE